LTKKKEESKKEKEIYFYNFSQTERKNVVTRKKEFWSKKER
jgi:hypothetical protein